MEKTTKIKKKRVITKEAVQETTEMKYETLVGFKPQPETL